MNIYEKLIKVQSELKAPKNQRNNFGGYNYRSCEDILEAVKPLLKENKLTLVIKDHVGNVGERYYIMAIATLIDIETGEKIETQAQARESETKKGMDDSQITGTASSYARKYCLNGLFLIDDTKDADTDEYKKQNESVKEFSISTISTTMEKALKDGIKANGIANEVVINELKKLGHSKLNELELVELMNFKKAIGVE